MASVLAKIQSLEREKQVMAATLETNNARLAKLQEGKKAEMETLMNSTISKWLEGLDTKDMAAKGQLKDGLQHLINEGNESGVWNVIACASNSWVANVNSIEALTNEVNSYKVSQSYPCLGLLNFRCSIRSIITMPTGEGKGVAGRHVYQRVQSYHGE